MKRFQFPAKFLTVLSLLIIDIAAFGQCNTSGGETIYFDYTDPTCAKPDSGDILITNFTGDYTPPFNVVWDDGTAGYNNPGLPAGDFSLSATDANGCVLDFTIDLTLQNAPPDYYLLYLDPICTADNGIYHVVMTAGATPYSYSWSNGSNDSSLNNLVAGTYSVTITDANNCSATGSWVLSSNEITLNVSVLAQNANCYGLENGYVAVADVPNANGNVYYSWDNGSTNYSTGNVGTGTYTVQVTDDDGCTGDASGIVTAPDPIVVTAETTSETCYESNDGSIFLSVQGGSDNYSFDWSPVGSGDEQTGLPPGNYTINVTDDNGCTGTTSTTIEAVTAITLSNETYYVSCNQNSTYLNVEFAGGTGDLNYAWTDGGLAPITFGQSSSTITNLRPNIIYAVFVTDENGCSTTFGWSYTLPQPFYTNFSASICSGDSYLFHGQTYTTSGNYPVTLTSQNGCDSIVTLNLTVNPAAVPAITINGNSAICNGEVTTFTANARNGGNSPTYQWTVNGVNTGNNSNTFTDSTLTNGAIVACLLTSNATCISTTTANSNSETITVGNLVNPGISITGGSIVCYGLTDTFTAIANGGGSTPVYQWKVNGVNAGPNSNTYITNPLTVGSTVTCILTTTAACANTSTANANIITVTIKPSPTANAGTGGHLCAGDSLIIGGNPTASGGTLPYTYSWHPTVNLAQPNVSNPVAAPPSSIRYTVIVTDGNGCSAVSSDSVTVNSRPVTPLIASNSPVFIGDTIKLTSGSLAGANYHWTGPNNFSSTQQNPSIPNATIGMKGTYILNVTLPDGCSGIPDTLVVDINNLSINGLVTNIVCSNDSNGSIALTAQGGIPAYTYLWSNGTTTQNISGLATGYYAVTVIDAALASASASFTITALNISVSNQIVCSGSSTTAIQFSGGPGGTVYNWANNNTSIGLGATGLGGIPSFAATDTSAAPAKAIITVTPTFISGSDTCIGLPVTFTIIVTPVPGIQTIGNQTLCSGSTTSAINFTGNNLPGGVYTWANSNPSIGLAASGTGNISTFTAINTGGTPEVANITVTPAVTEIAYITNNGFDNVYAINTATNTVIATISVSSQPSGLAASPDGSRVYVTNYASDSVSVINTLTHLVIATIGAGAQPYAVVVSPDERYVYVANVSSNNISVINANTNIVVNTINLSTKPQSLVISPNGKYLYASFQNTNQVGIINTATGTLTDTVSVGISPDGIGLSTDGGKVYVPCNYSNYVSVVSTFTNTVIDSITVGNTPREVCLNPDGSLLYVGNSDDNTVSVINTLNDSVIATVPVGSNPWGLCVTPDGSKVFVTNASDNSVSVINTTTNTVINTLTGFAYPQSFGSFFITGTSCSGIPETFTITVNNTVTPTVHQSGDTLISSASTGNQWYLNGNPISGATGQVYLPQQNGNYQLVVSDVNCSSDTSNMIHYINAGIQVEEGLDIKLYPNPTDKRLTIEGNIAKTSIQYNIYDVLGNRISEGHFAGYSDVIDVSDYATGAYLIRIQNEEQETAIKFIIER